MTNATKAALEASLKKLLSIAAKFYLLIVDIALACLET